MSKPLWKWNCDILWMLELFDNVQATSLYREASESGREARQKVHEGTLREGYMGRKDKERKKRMQREAGVILSDY